MFEDILHGFEDLEESNNNLEQQDDKWDTGGVWEDGTIWRSDVNEWMAQALG